MLALIVSRKGALLHTSQALSDEVFLGLFCFVIAFHARTQGFRDAKRRCTLRPVCVVVDPDFLLFGVLIPHTSYGVEIAGIAGIFFEILPEVKNEIIDGAGGGVHVITP